ncbi:YrhB domain-containing protein [Burkholderia lata]|uniref:YrhB domain-containing protein n=1 Tax=Burkholderia lata (strain ATCC 17760 / DSM 23089 / LMG 22485 / NCIMB 9086 / R18194 / 383) TaxID=482957 RepID=UPI001583E172
MTEISLAAAIEIAESYLNESVRTPHNSIEDDRWVVSMEKIVDCGECWLFHYQSALYLSTGDPAYLLAGNIPLRVSKAGVVLGFGKCE